MKLESYIRKSPEVIDVARLIEKTTIDTSQGRMTGEIGDWIVFGIKNEKYFCEKICKNGIFRRTYKAL